MDDRIDKSIERTSRVVLRCKLCDALFSTKNIDYVGARTIFRWNGYDTDGNTQLIDDETRDKVWTLATACDNMGHTLKELEVIDRIIAVQIANR